MAKEEEDGSQSYHCLNKGSEFGRSPDQPATVFSLSVAGASGEQGTLFGNDVKIGRMEGNPSASMNRHRIKRIVKTLRDASA